MPPMTKLERSEPRWLTWSKRFGLAGLTFFLVKGLLWLLVPTALVMLGNRGCQ